MKLRLNEVYGGYSYHGKNEEGKCKVKCVKCGHKRLLSKKKLLTNPTCKECKLDKAVKKDLKSIKSTESTAVQVFTHHEANPKGLSIEQAQQLPQSQTFIGFKTKVNELQKSLDLDKMDAQTNFQINSLKMLIDLIPVAEYEYRGDPKMSNMQSLNSVVNQVRELLADVMVEEDKAGLANRIVETTMIPYTHDILQMMLDTYYLLLRKTETMMKPKDYQELEAEFHTALKDMGRQLNDKRNFFINKLREGLTSE